LPLGKNREKTVVVIGDVKCRFVLAVPCRDEHAGTLSTILWERWFAVFSPPEHLLTDLGKPLLSAIMRNMCARAGVAKTFTSGCHPQCNGMVERFNRTMAADLAKTILCEESWPEHVAAFAFRYNNNVHSATGETPYRAMFGVDCFEFDAGINLRMCLNDEAEDLAVRLAEIHERLYDKSLSARSVAG
jgi:hypothetical protein